MIHGSSDSLRYRFFQNLVIPDGFVVGMQQDVRMAFDQSRQERLARQIYCVVDAGFRPPDSPRPRVRASASKLQKLFNTSPDWVES